MKQEKLKRIAIIGLPGSGKSTFAIKLGGLLNIPVYHLDKYMFDGEKKKDKQEFLLIKEALIKEESWIIEGCSISTLEMRFARSDIIFYFHLPRLLCLSRVCKRMFTIDKSLAETGCLNGINWRLIKYIWNFDRDKNQKIEELRQCYPEVKFLIFRHSQDSNRYLRNLTKF